MKMPVLVSLLLLVSFVRTASRQTIDSALAYFPVDNGDQWEYSYRWAITTYTTYYTITIEGDTLMPNGRTYKKILRKQSPDSSTSYTFVRIDSTTAKLYMFDLMAFGGDSLYDSLRLQIGSHSPRYPSAYLYKVDTTSFLGVSAITREFGGLTGGNIYRVAYGFGLIYASEVGTYEYPFYTNLVYAKINGVEYGTLVNVSKNTSQSPEQFRLQQNYPNPFNPTTRISFSVPTRSRVRLTIFNLLGQQVAELANKEMNAGSYERTWNANVASGLYFYRIEAVSVTDPGKTFVDVKKMIPLK